jgi:hypothetical protein
MRKAQFLSESKQVVKVVIRGNGAPARHKCWLSSTKNLEEVIVIEHTETCPVYDNGPCDCGVDEHMTDEQIDFELFEKEAAKD